MVERRMNHWDVVIVGGGIAGASLGAEVAAKRRTLLIEAEEHCAMHATGRSAAFWLVHYGGPFVMPLTLASRRPLEEGWPTGERSWLRQRGAITIARDYTDLRDALSMQTAKAPLLRQVKRAELEELVPGLRTGWEFGVYDLSCADIDVAGLHAACLAAFRRAGGTVVQATPLVRARRARDSWK